MNTATFKELPRKHRAATCLLGLSIVLGSLVFYRSGLVSERTRLVEEKTTEGRRLQTNITNASLLKEQTESLVETNKQITRQLVNPNQLGENLQFFYRIETASSTKITDLRQTYAPLPNRPTKGLFVPIPYAVSVQGEYRGLLNFLRRIEKSSRLSRVVSGSIQPGTSGDRGSAGTDLVTLALNVELLGTP